MEIDSFPGYELWFDGMTEEPCVWSNRASPTLGKNGGFMKTKIDRGGYCIINLRNSQGHRLNQKFHRVVALACIPNPENLPTVDHINNDKTDNRVSNLRWCSRSDQNRNISTQRGYTCRPSGKYEASIRINGKSVHLGTFRTPDLAAAAYRTACMKHFPGVRADLKEDEM